MRTFLVFLAVVCLLLALAVPVFAQNLEEIPTFDTWLMWASGPLVVVIVGLILSVVVEWWPAYGKLAPRVSRLAFFGLCIAVPMLAATARAALGFAEWSFDPLYWHAIWQGMGAAGVGTLLHARKLPNG